MRAARTATLLVLLLGASACASRPRWMQSKPARAWPETLASAQRAAAAGKYAEADRELERFSKEHGGTPQGDESVFWRALFMVDPANKDARAREAIPLLDLYLTRSERPRHAEALVLKRTAQAIDALARAAVDRQPVASLPAGTPRTAPEDAARDEELVKLREELARTQDELERIKRRLAAPRP